MKTQLFDLNNLLHGSLIHLTCRLQQKVERIETAESIMLKTSAISNILNFITKIKLGNDRSYHHTHYNCIHKLNDRLSIYNIIDQYDQFKKIHAFNIFTIFQSQTSITDKVTVQNLQKNTDMAKKYGAIIIIICHDDSICHNMSTFDHIFTYNMDDINKSLYDNKIMTVINKHTNALNCMVQKKEIYNYLIEENQSSYFRYMTIGQNNLFDLISLIKLINSNNSVYHLPTGELDNLLKKIHEMYVFAKLWFNTIDNMNSDICYGIFYKLSSVSKSFFNCKLLEYSK